jgi:hypothetical protein
MLLPWAAGSLPHLWPSKVSSMRPLTLTLGAAALCLPLCASAEPAADWMLAEGEVLTLLAGEDPTVVVTCPEARARLDITVIPAWEEGYATADGGTFAGPYDKVDVRIGTTTVPAVEDPAATAASPYGGRSYTLPADADTVTAIMLGDNITVTLTSDGQERSGMIDSEGVLNLFATTCAQINGL